MLLQPLDWIIIVLSLAVCFVPALLLARRSGKSTTEFFASGRAVPGVSGFGPVILAVDNLPCELPVDASQHFGDALLRFLPALTRCDWSEPFASLELADELRRALVVHSGRLTPSYAYLERFLT